MYFVKYEFSEIAPTEAQQRQTKRTRSYKLEENVIMIVDLAKIMDKGSLACFWLIVYSSAMMMMMRVVSL